MLHVLSLSCPTRRSSDLLRCFYLFVCAVWLLCLDCDVVMQESCIPTLPQFIPECGVRGFRCENVIEDIRSEEHTSELQSLMRISYAVFCLKQKTEVLKTSYAHKTSDIAHSYEVTQ